MQAIIDFLESLVPEQFDGPTFLKSAAMLLLGTLLLAVLTRLIFKKKSTLNRSISSAINILFIYAITIVITSFGVDLGFMLAPLPFVNIEGDYLKLLIYPIENYPLICEQLVSMILLAFLANLANGWLPEGKRLFGWFFFRCLSVLIAMAMHIVVTLIFQALLPEGILTYAPMILLGMLLLMLMTGALKIVIGALMATVNPLIAALYTFFFASVVGKQITKAVLTTVLLSLMVYLLYTVGCTAIYIASAALAAYIPFLLLLLVVWYLVGHLL